MIPVTTWLVTEGADPGISLEVARLERFLPSKVCDPRRPPQRLGRSTRRQAFYLGAKLRQTTERGNHFCPVSVPLPSQPRDDAIGASVPQYPSLVNDENLCNGLLQGFVENSRKPEVQKNRRHSI